MIRYVVFLTIFFSLFSNAQESDFEKLQSLFTQSRKQIPEDLALKYFDFKSTERANGLLTGAIIVKAADYIIFSTILGCNMGGSCEQSSLTSFNKIGERIDTIAFERTMADCSFDDKRAAVFIAENLLVFKEIRTKLDCLGGGKQIGEKVWLEFQPIKDDGSFSKPYSDFKAIERENYIFSHRVFSKEELDDRTMDELDVIKNEIFASHGYVFTKKKWQDYFESKTWYIPSDTDAVHKLTEIEKKNIEVILSMKQ
ncbi:YARHG domain-containing protein [Aquimarina sp. SS2-1]|uniref:YARHG domain-containing protein n=1 Tax=Aquimarina besae TaxID=3342247 RepID=UPI003670CE3C